MVLTYEYFLSLKDGAVPSTDSIPSEAKESDCKVLDKNYSNYYDAKFTKLFQSKYRHSPVQGKTNKNWSSGSSSSVSTFSPKTPASKPVRLPPTTEKVIIGKLNKISPVSFDKISNDLRKILDENPDHEDSFVEQVWTISHKQPGYIDLYVKLMQKGGVRSVDTLSKHALLFLTDLVIPVDIDLTKKMEDYDLFCEHQKNLTSFKGKIYAIINFVKYGILNITKEFLLSKINIPSLYTTSSVVLECMQYYHSLMTLEDSIIISLGVVAENMKEEDKRYRFIIQDIIERRSLTK
jgi:hypothetical protein